MHCDYLNEHCVYVINRCQKVLKKIPIEYYREAVTRVQTELERVRHSKAGMRDDGVCQSTDSTDERTGLSGLQGLPFYVH